jgi:ABC-type nitrate/sulfonate/bicarbonate transport system substrate-binding protein
MRRGGSPVVLVMILLLSMGTVFGVTKVSAEPPIPINIGYQDNPDWLFYVARDLKLFEKVGLAPTYVKFVAGAPMIAAAQGKSIDVAALGTVPFLVGLSQGLDWTMIGINLEGAYVVGIVARKDSSIDSFADLKGKRVGVFKGSTTHYGLIMTLRQHGIGPDQVTLLHMSPAEQLAALAKRDIDAAMVWEPWMQRMVYEVNARIIATLGDFGIYDNVNGYCVRRDWLRDNREAAVRFVRALLMAHEALQKDHTVGIRSLTEAMEINETWAETIFRNAPPPKIYEWANFRYNYSLVKDSPLHRRLGHLATFLLDERIVTKQVDVSKAVDASVISEVLKTWKMNQ